MNIARDFVNCLAVIYDSGGRRIARTVVTEHDKRDMSVGISETLEGIKAGTRLTILIVCQDGPLEFGGVVRRKSQSGCVISLFSERQREERFTARYTLDIPAVVNSIVVNSEQTPLDSPLNIVIDNISASGLLIKSPLRSFTAGAILEIEAEIGDKEVLLHAMVIREQFNSDFTYGFGCKLVFKE